MAVCWSGANVVAEVAGAEVVDGPGECLVLEDTEFATDEGGLAELVATVNVCKVVEILLASDVAETDAMFLVVLLSLDRRADADVVDGSGVVLVPDDTVSAVDEDGFATAFVAIDVLFPGAVAETDAAVSLDAVTVNGSTPPEATVVEPLVSV